MKPRKWWGGSTWQGYKETENTAAGGCRELFFWLQKVLGSQTAGFPDRQEQSALEQTPAEMRRWHRGSGRNQQGGLLSVLPIPTLGCAQSVLFSRAALVNTAKLVFNNGFLNRFLAHQRCRVPLPEGLPSLISALSPILLLLGCHCFSAVQILALFNCCRSNPLSQPWNKRGLFPQGNTSFQILTLLVFLFRSLPNCRLIRLSFIICTWI